MWLRPKPRLAPGALAAYTPSLVIAAPVPDRLAAYIPSLVIKIFAEFNCYDDGL